MHRKFYVISILLILCLQAYPYGEKSIEKMVDGVIWLAPPSLKGFLSAYRGNLIDGIKDTIKKDHNLKFNDLIKNLEIEINELKTLVSTHPSFEMVAYKFGKSAGIVFLLDDPLRETDDKRIMAIRDDYKKYIEIKISKLILTFDGYDNPPFEKPIKSYFEKRSEAFERYRDALLFCYFKEGKLISSKNFDDKSNAFGVAQVILSRSVSDAAKVYLEIWKSMGGDLEDTPYLEKRGKK